MPHYDLIDFAIVLIGYILSGEPKRLSFYERLARLRLILHGAFWPEPPCLIAQRCLGFWLLSIKKVGRRFGRSFEIRLACPQTVSFRL
jgi:hypothetical protein